MSAAESLPSSSGDFTATPRVLPITLLAVVIGGAAALFAFALLRLIGFCTNVFSLAVFSLSSPPQGT